MGTRRQWQGGGALTPGNVLNFLSISSYSEGVCFEGDDEKVVNFFRKKVHPWKKILQAPTQV